MRTSLLIAGLTVGIAVAASGQTSAKVIPGQQVFQARCVGCHGADGSGETPMGKQLNAKNLTSPEVQKLSADAMKKVVSDGQGNMPAFGDRLSDDEIAQVIGYVRGLGKKKK